MVPILWFCCQTTNIGQSLLGPEIYQTVFNNDSTAKDVSEKVIAIILKAESEKSTKMRKETEAKNVSTTIATNLEAQNKGVLQEINFNITVPNSNNLTVLHNHLQSSKIVQICNGLPSICKVGNQSTVDPSWTESLKFYIRLPNMR